MYTVCAEHNYMYYILETNKIMVLSNDNMYTQECYCNVVHTHTCCCVKLYTLTFAENCSFF